MGDFLKETLKDKNKLSMLVPLFLGVLLVIVFFGKREEPAESASNTGEMNQAFLEPDTEGEERVANKADAYRHEQEEATRKKRGLEKSQVKGSDSYSEMQTFEDEYNGEIGAHVEKVKRDPLDEATSEYKERGKKSNSAFSGRMHQQLNDIEDQKTFNQVVKKAKREERIRKELGEDARLRDEMRKKYQDQASRKDTEKSQENTFPRVNDSVPKVEKASKPTLMVESRKWRRQSQFTIDQKVNLIRVAIYGGQTIVSGSAVRMRLLESLWADGVEIPANTVFYGNVGVGSTRLKITVENVRYEEYISSVAFIVYNSDAIGRLSLPNNMKAEAARKMEQGLLQGVQLPISSIGTVTSEVTSVITATTQVIRQTLNRSLSQVEVHLKANYSIYIKEKTNRDRKEREEEEVGTGYLYRGMQM